MNVSDVRFVIYTWRFGNLRRVSERGRYLWFRLPNIQGTNIYLIPCDKMLALAIILSY
jgi:hypothetical protein